MSDKASTATQRTEAPAVQDVGLGNAVDQERRSVDPKDVAEPLPEDASNDTVAEGKHKAPQTVHLPPKEVQEARLQETDRKLENAANKERKEEERLAIPQAGGPADVVSSPSSSGYDSLSVSCAPEGTRSGVGASCMSSSAALSTILGALTLMRRAARSSGLL